AGDVITVCGARGGLGATTIAVNLAHRIATTAGVETALVDLDLQRGDIGAFLNLAPVNSLAAFASPRTQVDAAFLRGALAPRPSVRRCWSPGPCRGPSAWRTRCGRSARTHSSSCPATRPRRAQR